MRVTLGRPLAADTLAISVAFLDVDVAEWLSTFPFAFEPHDNPDRSLDAAMNGDYAIKVDGRFAGLVIASPEFGCWIDPKYYGGGIATRAATMALSRHFAGGADIAYARCAVANRQMCRLLDRLGFEQDDELAQGEQGLTVARLTRRSLGNAQPFHIQAARFDIRGIHDRDIDSLYDFASKREILNMQCPYGSKGMSLADFRECVFPFEGTPPFSASIRISGRNVGLLGIGAGQHAEIVFCIAPEVWGLGVASEAVSLFAGEVIDRFGLESLWGDVLVKNAGAIRVLERAGFTRESSVALNAGPGFRYRLMK